MQSLIVSMSTVIVDIDETWSPTGPDYPLTWPTSGWPPIIKPQYNFKYLLIFFILFIDSYANRSYMNHLCIQLSIVYSCPCLLQEHKHKEKTFK